MNPDTIKTVSIHAPLAGSDTFKDNRPFAYPEFQSTLPSQGATLAALFSATCFATFQSPPPSQGPTVVANASRSLGASDAQRLAKWARNGRKPLANDAVQAARVQTWFDSELSWPSGNPRNLALVADLERRIMARASVRR